MIGRGLGPQPAAGVRPPRVVEHPNQTVEDELEA